MSELLPQPHQDLCDHQDLCERLQNLLAEALSQLAQLEEKCPLMPPATPLYEALIEEFHSIQNSVTLFKRSTLLLHRKSGYPYQYGSSFPDPTRESVLKLIQSTHPEQVEAILQALEKLLALIPKYKKEREKEIETDLAQHQNLIRDLALQATLLRLDPKRRQEEDVE